MLVLLLFRIPLRVVVSYSGDHKGQWATCSAKSSLINESKNEDLQIYKHD